MSSYESRSCWVLIDVQARASTSQAIVSGPNQGIGQALATKQPTPLSWRQKMLGLGAIVAAGAGAGVLTKVCLDDDSLLHAFMWGWHRKVVLWQSASLFLSLQVYLLPKFKAWVRSILTEENDTDKKVSPSSPGLPAEAPVNETALAANAAAAAASEVAAAMREFSNSRVKGNSLYLSWSTLWLLILDVSVLSNHDDYHLFFGYERQKLFEILQAHCDSQLIKCMDELWE